MAAITVDETKVRLVQKIETENVVLGEAIAVGAWVRYDASTGKVVNANATTAAEAKVIGMVISKDGAGNRGTVVRKGLVEVGSALGGVNFGAQVYLSDTDGVTDSAAGTVATVVGKVSAVFGGPAASASRLLRVDL